VITLVVTEKQSQTWLKSMIIIAKIILLTFVFMIVTGISAGIAGFDSGSLVENASQIMGITLLVFFLQTIALSYPILQSNLRSLHLVILVALVYFGITVFLVQIETLVFMNYFMDIISPDMILHLFVQGAITAVIFAPIAVFVLRGWKNSSGIGLQSVRLGMSKMQGLMKVSVLAVVFVIFYVLFGIFIAWQNPAMSDYYGDLIARMAAVGGWMLLLQAGRGVVFIVLAVPVIQTSKGRTWEKAIMTGLLFCILTASNLLIPTTIMPDTIRMSHFYEVAIPGFIFGLLVGWLMNRSHTSIGELFGRPQRGIEEAKTEMEHPYAVVT
jgi:hypothetical protein